mmetsp:Transcript_14368/g.39573  ORF Transcript_14368/g.39573 Transcript_14368/m.39573 type:complete len:209 (-) Transcript_14368:51-677(-)
MWWTDSMIPTNRAHEIDHATGMLTCDTPRDLLTRAFPAATFPDTIRDESAPRSFDRPTKAPPSPANVTLHALSKMGSRSQLREPSSSPAPPSVPTSSSFPSVILRHRESPCLSTCTCTCASTSVQSPNKVSCSPGRERERERERQTTRGEQKKRRKIFSSEAKGAKDCGHHLPFCFVSLAEFLIFVAEQRAKLVTILANERIRITSER